MIMILLAVPCMGFNFMILAEQRRCDAEDRDTAAGREGERERGQRGGGDGAAARRQDGEVGDDEGPLGQREGRGRG